MPNLIDIAQRFAEQPTLALLHEKRCLSERDLSASCTVCADACPTHAIVVGAERPAVDPLASHGSVNPMGPTGPRIDEDACVRCGRCIVTCPTAALVAAAPLDDQALLDAAARIGVAAGARMTGEEGNDLDADDPTDDVADDSPSATETLSCGFACERAAEKLRIDSRRVAVLPCLAWIDEAVLVHAAVSGARLISLLTAPCASCAHAGAVADLSRTVENAQRVLDTWGIEAAIDLTTESPSHLHAAPDAEAVGELSRRGLFSQARSALIDAASEAATAQVEALVGASTDGRTADPEPDRRRWQLLDDLHAAELPEGGTSVVPRVLAPRVDIAVDGCSGCALCAVFCPTGALRKTGKGSGGTTLLEFDAALCRDCGVCTDTCRYGAISREEALTADELFALEPREIVIPKRRVLPSRKSS